MECRGANKLRSSILLPSGVGNIIYGSDRLTERAMALSEDYLLLRGTTPFPPTDPATPQDRRVYKRFYIHTAPRVVSLITIHSS